MTEIVGTVAAVGSLLKAVTSTVSLLQGINRAPYEARQVASQIHATKAVLRSLQASLNIVHQPQEFLDIWNGPTRLVLKNVKTTIEELNARLGGTGSTPPRLVKLSFWSRLKWPLERGEGVVLQLQLQGYFQLLTLVQSSLTKGTASDMRASALEIEDILSKTTTISATSTSLSSLSLGNTSTSTARENEFEVYSEPNGKVSRRELSGSYSYPNLNSPSTIVSGRTQDFGTVNAVSDLEDPSQPVQFPTRLDLLLNKRNRCQLRCGDFSFGRSGSKLESLGRGGINLYETVLCGYRPVLWIVFTSDLCHQVSRWWSDPRVIKCERKRNTGTDRYSGVSVRAVFPDIADNLPKAEALEFRGSPSDIARFLEVLPKAITSLKREIELRKSRSERREAEEKKWEAEEKKLEAERARRESQSEAARRCAARMAPRPSMIHRVLQLDTAAETKGSLARTTSSPRANPSTRTPGFSINTLCLPLLILP